jgi:hypothetical protein
MGAESCVLPLYVHSSCKGAEDWERIRQQWEAHLRSFSQTRRKVLIFMVTGNAGHGVGYTADVLLISRSTQRSDHDVFAYEHFLSVVIVMSLDYNCPSWTVGVCSRGAAGQSRINELSQRRTREYVSNSVLLQSSVLMDYEHEDVFEGLKLRGQQEQGLAMDLTFPRAVSNEKR